MLGLALLTSAVSADVSGEVRGHAFTVEASVAGLPALSVNRIDLPPGGTSGLSVNAGLLGVVDITSGTAATRCDGVTSGAEVVASCSSVVEDLSIGVSGVLLLPDIVLLQATELRAVSRSSDDGSGGVSIDSDPGIPEATTFSGVCVILDAGDISGGCTNISAPGTYPINITTILGVPLVTGTLVLEGQTPRSTDGALTGSGLTVTMLRLSLQISVLSALEITVAEADSFVGDVEELPTATPTATPTNTPEPTATPTDTPVPTATPTDTPVPTATPTDTPVPTATPTDTPVPTATPTDTPVPTATPTDTPVPTATPTDTPVPTATPTSTPVPTATPTDTPVPTATPTDTPEPTATPTSTPASSDAAGPEETPPSAAIAPPVATLGSPGVVAPAPPPQGPLDDDTSSLPNRLPNAGSWAPGHVTHSTTSMAFLLLSILSAFAGLAGITRRTQRD
jgi:outer membrane biosynthesis protein TonB